MTKQRKNYSADFKAKVAIAVIKGDKTINEFASTFGIHPNQVTTWKKQALSIISDAFSARQARQAEFDEELKARFYQQIGQLKLDWYSRYVVEWEVSVTLDGSFCVGALDRALLRGQPSIFNTDQGTQFTSQSFTNKLQARGIHISMDGLGRALDNIFVERLWRSVKYEEVYLKDYRSVMEAKQGLRSYFEFYNRQR